MLLLAIETSAKAASVALHDGNVLLGESYQNTGLTHSQTLMAMAEDLLKQCGHTPQEVTDVAVAAGPGSFTGVRIGVAAAKGYAWGGEINCWGVSTLDAMARHLGIYEGHICCCMDARRNQVYNALFYVNRGTLVRKSDDRAIALADLKTELAEIDAPIYLVGDGAELACRTLEMTNLVLAAEHKRHQRATGVALAALEKMAREESASGAELTPNYLRLSQAERERAEKMQK